MLGIPLCDLPPCEHIPLPLEGLEDIACGPFVVRKGHRGACLGGRERGGGCLGVFWQVGSDLSPGPVEGERLVVGLDPVGFEVDPALVGDEGLSYRGGRPEEGVRLQAKRLA